MDFIDPAAPEMQLLAELVPPGSYRTPDAIQCLGVALGGNTGPPLLHLQLEGGLQLAIPLTQDAMRQLYDSARRHGSR